MFDFKTLGLDPVLMKALKRANLTEPTPIQAKAIPLALEGRDILGLAQTGTGKTLAFGLPLMNALLANRGKPDPKTVKALILAPTRELVNQIAENLGRLAYGTPLAITCVVGGQSIGKQINQLRKGTDILVATPGRLIDLMDRRALHLSTARNLVLDEADQMLDMGFIHALRQIAPHLGRPRQTMMFSATMPKQMAELSEAYLDNPERIQVAPSGKAADKITQSIHFLPKPDKPQKLRELLAQDPNAMTLIFSRTKHGAERMKKGLAADGFKAVSIHGNKSQGQRDQALKAFKKGAAKILVATDVAARGIDIPGVSYVINYDLPEVAENYIHRIGRTARAGAEGEAIALCSPDEANLLRQIQKLMKMDIPVASGETPSGAIPPSHKSKRGRKSAPKRSPQAGPISDQPPAAHAKKNPKPKPKAKPKAKSKHKAEPAEPYVPREPIRPTEPQVEGEARLKRKSGSKKRPQPNAAEPQTADQKPSKSKKRKSAKRRVRKAKAAFPSSN